MGLTAAPLLLLLWSFCVLHVYTCFVCILFPPRSRPYPASMALQPACAPRCAGSSTTGSASDSVQCSGFTNQAFVCQLQAGASKVRMFPEVIASLQKLARKTPRMSVGSGLRPSGAWVPQLLFASMLRLHHLSPSQPAVGAAPCSLCVCRPVPSPRCFKISLW